MWIITVLFLSSDITQQLRLKRCSQDSLRTIACFHSFWGLTSQRPLHLYIHLYIHLLEIPHFSLQQGSLHHHIHFDCLRRQPLVEKRKQGKPPTKSYRKFVKQRRVVCRLKPAEQINLKHIPINPQWKTKITLKQVKFVAIYSLLWLLFVKGLTIAAS